MTTAAAVLSALLGVGVSRLPIDIAALCAAGCCSTDDGPSARVSGNRIVNVGSLNHFVCGNFAWRSDLDQAYRRGKGLFQEWYENKLRTGLSVTAPFAAKPTALLAEFAEDTRCRNPGFSTVAISAEKRIGFASEITFGLGERSKVWKTSSNASCENSSPEPRLPRVSWTNFLVSSLSESLD